MLLQPVVQHHGQDPGGDGRCGRDFELTRIERERHPRGPSRALGVAQRRARLAEQSLAGGGDPYAARQALEQRPAELALERGDLLRERGLGDEQALGRRGERPLLDDGDEILELAEVHSYKYCLSRSAENLYRSYAK